MRKTQMTNQQRCKLCIGSNGLIVKKFVTKTKSQKWKQFSTPSSKLLLLQTNEISQEDPIFQSST
jgi:hypothetical protein